MSESKSAHAGMAGPIDVGGDLTVNRVGFGAMRITGAGIWGEPADRGEAKAVLRRAVGLVTEAQLRRAATACRRGRSCSPGCWPAHRRSCRSPAPERYPTWRTTSPPRRSS